MLIVKKGGGLGTFLPPFSIGYPVPTALHMIVGSDLFSFFPFSIWQGPTEWSFIFCFADFMMDNVPKSERVHCIQTKIYYSFCLVL